MNKRKTCTFYASALFLLILTIWGCKKEEEILQPKILRIEPSSAGPGEYITIIGENFQFATKLIIGEKNINEKPALKDTFITLIPELTPGIVTVFFEYVKGESNHINYTILSPRPYISQLSSDTVNVLDTLIIKGGNFGANPSVYLENNPIDKINTSTDTSITAVIPLDANSGNLYISSNNRESSSKYIWITNSKVPTIESLTPDSFLVGDTILLEGKNFVDDSISILFNDTNAEDYWLLPNQQIEVIVPEITISGIITVKTVFGEDKKAFTLIDKQTLVPIVTEQQYTVYIGETIIIEGKNLGGSNNIQLEYNGSIISNNSYSIVSDNEIRLFTNLLGASGVLIVKNNFGTVSININLKQPPSITEHRPSQNPKDWPILIVGDNFEDVQEIIFEKANDKFALSINDSRVQQNIQQKTIGVKIPELNPGDYNVYLKIKDEVFSNKIDFKIIDYTPSGLPGTGSTSLVIPNNPPAASLSSFNNVWSFINTGNTINFDDQSSFDDEFGEFQEFEDAPLKTSGSYKKDGSLIEITFTDNFGSHEYIGSLDDKYWDSPESKKGVYRVILTPRKEGKQIELIFPLGLDSIAPSTTNTQNEIILYGKLFHEFEFYEVRFTNQKGQTSIFSSFETAVTIISQTELQINLSELGLSNGEYKIDIDFNGGISNSINYEIK